MRGVSLVELALALVILGVLLSGAARLALIQAQRGAIDRTGQELEMAKTALRGFVALHGRLPCPDLDGDDAAGFGLEDVDDGGCRGEEGRLPFATLGGIGRLDAWGNGLRYRVVPELARVPNAGAAAFIRVCAGDAAGACGRLLADNVAALILSHGPNGNGAGARPMLPATPHERANADGDASAGGRIRWFVSHEPRGAGGDGGEFDDMMVWLPYSVYRAGLLDR